MNRWRSLIVLCTLISVAVPEISANDRLPVFVSVLPQKYFVQQIGKDHVNVQVMVQPGASPATYEPKPRQMAALAEARLYFSIGVAFESVWLEKIMAANPAMMLVPTDAGIRKIPMATHHHHGEETPKEAENDHGDMADHGILDPHIWLSPPLVKQQAGKILEALKAADPHHSPDYDANYQGFIAKIESLDGALKKTFAGKKGLRFMVFHPAWGYFAHAYGLEQVPIEIEGKNPKPAQLEALISQAREQQIRVVFVQPQFSSKRAELVAREIGGQVVLADPLALDWLTNLQVVAGKFDAALK
jgi:zinc transport system substrate-binding protein